MTARDATVTPTEVEWHRAAAWFAGEGSVRWRDRKIAVTVSQKERSVCDWLLARFGGSVSLREATPTRSYIHCWIVCGDRARAFLQGIENLMPESLRRTIQVRSALYFTAGKRKTGTKPSLICKRGHVKEQLGECKICAAEARRKYRESPQVLEKHRIREHERYHNDPATRARNLAGSKERAAKRKEMKNAG